MATRYTYGTGPGEQPGARPTPTRLFGSPNCPYTMKVKQALDRRGMQYEFVHVDPHAKPELLARINPENKIPVLEFQGEYVSDSDRIFARLDSA
eukprot:tig00000378_g24513.t1